MSKKITKEELRTDFFLSHAGQVANFLARYKVPIVTVCLLALVGAVGWMTMNYIQNRQEHNAAAAFYPVEKKLQDEIEKTKTVSDAALAEYEKVLVGNPARRATLVSLVSVAPTLMKASKASRALEWFRKMTYQPVRTEVHFALAKMTEGLLALESKQPDQALTSYQAILTNDSQKAFHPEALLKTGVAFEMKNDHDKAKETFEKIRREHPTSEAGELAFEYLLFMQLKKGA